MLNEVKHLAIAREILRFRQSYGVQVAQNDRAHHLTYDRALKRLT
jgi:hypothetical protein